MLNMVTSLGRLGNSGNSTEPHIHFQVMNDEEYWSMYIFKIRFINNRELIKGDVVCGFKRWMIVMLENLDTIKMA